jgi:uncharacterized protein
MSQPTTRVTRLPENQRSSRAELDALLDSTPLATVALIRECWPVAFPIGFMRRGDEVVIHGSTGSPWLNALSDGASATVSVTTIDGIVVARSGFESSFWYHSATLFGTFSRIPDQDKVDYLNALTDAFIPGRVAELRPSTRKELAATQVLRLAIGEQNWSLKVNDGWPEDPPEDVAAGVWAGVVPYAGRHGSPLPAPDCGAEVPVPQSVLRMTTGSDDGR